VLATVRRPNCKCGFAAYSFHEAIHQNAASVGGNLSVSIVHHAAETVARRSIEEVHQHWLAARFFSARELDFGGTVQVED
jgi:hypothetical protein